MTINKNLMSLNHTPLKRSKSDIQFIVIHYVGALGDAKANTDYYKSQYVGASADFWVGFNGDVWQGNDYHNYYSWAIGGGLQGSGPHPWYQIALNSNSVSIEMCVRKRNTATMNATDKDWYFEDATIESSAKLTAQLMNELNINIDHVIRHYDVNAKICPNPFVYNTGKITWDGFLKKVLSYLNTSDANAGSGNDSAPGLENNHSGSSAYDNLYRVGTGWQNGRCVNQKGAFTILDNARSFASACGSSYNVYRSDGEIVHTYTEDKISPPTSFKPYTVKISAPDVYIRSGPGISYHPKGFTGIGTFTIVDEARDASSQLWGLLKSYEKLKDGWVALWLSCVNKTDIH